MLSWADLGNLIQKLDYSGVLPALARTPLGIGENLARLRGGIQALFDYEWRSMAIGQRYVRGRTYEAMKMISPDGHRLRWMLQTLLRFTHNSREEWQACLFGQKRMAGIAARSTVEGLDSLLRDGQGRGLVLVSTHFDSFCMGMVILGMKGLRVNVINTAMIEDGRIHPAVRVFFSRKYRSMEALMNGRMAYYQTEMPYFFQALREGETVVLLGDIPGSRSTIRIPFLGRSFRLPLGAWHMARETGSRLGAFVCLHEAPGRFRVVCRPPVEIDPDSPVNSLKPVYAFLESWIRRMPERWTAADLLPSYEA